jgi:zinc protease
MRSSRCEEWFQTYYGPANAVLVIAGDVDPKVAREKVEHYFGDIPSGPPVGRQDAWIAKRTGSQRGVLQDRVPQARLYRVWNVPGGARPTASIWACWGGCCRLGRPRGCTSVWCMTIRSQLMWPRSSMPARSGACSSFSHAGPGDDLTKVERAVNEEMAGCSAPVQRPPSWPGSRPISGLT